MSKPIINQIVNGQSTPCIELDFKVSDEQFNRYELLDGGEVRVKTVVLRIFQVVDDQGHVKLQADGTPLVIINNQCFVVATR